MSYHQCGTPQASMTLQTQNGCVRMPPMPLGQAEGESPGLFSRAWSWLKSDPIWAGVAVVGALIALHHTGLVRLSNPITKTKRRRIPKAKFAIPERRAFPIDTERRARAALSYLRMGRVRAEDYQRVVAAVRSRWPGVWFRYGKGLTMTKAMAAKQKGYARRHGKKQRRAA